MMTMIMCMGFMHRMRCPVYSVLHYTALPAAFSVCRLLHRLEYNNPCHTWKERINSVTPTPASPGKPSTSNQIQSRSRQRTSKLTNDERNPGISRHMNRLPAARPELAAPERSHVVPCLPRMDLVSSTSGTTAKLYIGAGEGIDHSSVRPFQGSPVVSRSPYLML